MSKDVSPKFFGAAGTYSNFNSTALAKQIVNELAGQTSDVQASVSSINVIDEAQEKAGKQIDALVEVTKKNLTQQISKVGSAALNTSAAPLTIVTSAMLTATTNSTPSPTAASSPSAAGSVVDIAKTAEMAPPRTDTTKTTSSSDTKKTQPNDAEFTTIDIEPSNDEIANTKAATLSPPPPPPPQTTPIYQYILLAIAAITVLMVIFLVAYMIYTKKSLSETWNALTGKSNSATNMGQK